MRTRSLVLLGGVALALAGAAWWLLDRDTAAETVGTGLALPGFAARVDAVDRIEVVGAGAKTLVAIEKHDGLWRMPGREDWPANQREVGKALFQLGQARRIEAKTANPALHAKLAVEDIGGAEAQGAELRLSGGGEPLRLLVGNNHPALGGSYVRLGDEPQAWLLDTDIAPARDPADWLDRRLLDIPMARIDVIRVAPAGGRAFALSRVDDRFSLDGRPPALMVNPDIGNATAGFTDQLALDDVAADSEAVATREVVFEGLDGVRISVGAWRQDDGTWARLGAELDRERAQQWLAQTATDAVAGGPGDAAATADDEAGAAAATDEVDAAGSTADTAEQRLAALEQQVAQLQARFAGKQFLLPPHKAEGLMRDRSQYLAGE